MNTGIIDEIKEAVLDLDGAEWDLVIEMSDHEIWAIVRSHGSFEAKLDALCQRARRLLATQQGQLELL